jgi:hypothetical protein
MQSVFGKKGDPGEGVSALSTLIARVWRVGFGNFGGLCSFVSFWRVCREISVALYVRCMSHASKSSLCCSLAIDANNKILHKFASSLAFRQGPVSAVIFSTVVLVHEPAIWNPVTMVWSGQPRKVHGFQNFKRAPRLCPSVSATVTSMHLLCQTPLVCSW